MEDGIQDPFVDELISVFLNFAHLGTHIASASLIGDTESNWSPGMDPGTVREQSLFDHPVWNHGHSGSSYGRTVPVVGGPSVPGVCLLLGRPLLLS